MQYYLQLFSLLICFIRLGGAQYPCTAPDNSYGYCTRINLCPDFYNFWSMNQYFLLYNTYCGLNFGYGSVILVCCPSNQIPNTEEISTITYTTTSTATPTPKIPKVALPQPGVCGAVMSDRIVHGEDTAINEFPWMAMIEYTHPDDGSKSRDCGGVLINENYVLTASHCVKSLKLTQQSIKVTGVRLGEWDTRTNPDCDENTCADPFQNIPVSDVIQHEDFNENSMANDIALLRLEYSVNYTDWIKPICLPTTEVADAIAEGTELTVAGWGTTENERRSNLKKKAILSVVPHNRCNRAFRRQSFTMTNGQLCAQGEKNQDSCNGDSGGPLIFRYRNRLNVQFYLVGVVSFGGRQCGQSGIPSVYTRVYPYMNWILDNMKP